jgi:hypothetical protein
MRLVRCLLSELDAAGRTYALETPLLLSSDGITADVELGQCPHIFDGIGNSDSTRIAGALRSCFLVAAISMLEPVTSYVSRMASPTSWEQRSSKIVAGQIQ